MFYNSTNCAHLFVIGDDRRFSYLCYNVVNICGKIKMFLISVFVATTWKGNKQKLQINLTLNLLITIG